MIALIPDETALALCNAAIRSVVGVIDDAVLVLDERSIPCEDRIPGARIVRHVFEDFSSQRNFAASLCSSRWVLFLDHDDYFQMLGDLRSTMENAPPEADTIDCDEVTVNERGEMIERGTTVVAYDPRACRWKYRGHNDLAGRKTTIRSTALQVYRHAPASDAKARAARTIPLLLRDLEENPGDAHAPFFLSRACWLAGDVAGMRKWARVCEDMAPASVAHSPAYVMDAMATLDLEGPEACRAVLERGLKLHPSGMIDLEDLMGFYWKARWMRSCQDRANPYLACHMSSPRTLARFIEVAASIGWPVARKKEAPKP